MKKYILLILQIACEYFCSAQTNYLPQPSGNVGIGASNPPSATLHVGSGTGNLHYGNNGVLVKFNNGDRALVELHSPDGQNRLVLQSLSHASYLSSLESKPLLLQDGGGKVGIGTTNPFAGQLQINGSNSPGLGGDLWITNSGTNAVGSYSRLAFSPDASTDQVPNAGIENIMTNTTSTYTSDLAFKIWDGSGYNEKFRIMSSGNVGINTTAPRSKLDIWGGQLNVTGADYNGTLVAGALNGNAYLGCNNLTSGISISPSGNVGIGAINPFGHRLAVNGSAIFTKAVVKQYGSWPDYVFDSTYQLKSLKEVEQYINVHKHLPGVPSTKEVEKNGLDVGETQATLLKKIEELTLYIIEQDKTIKEQNKKIEDQLNEIKELQGIKEDLKEIKSKLQNIN